MKTMTDEQLQGAPGRIGSLRRSLARGVEYRTIPIRRVRLRTRSRQWPKPDFIVDEATDPYDVDVDENDVHLDFMPNSTVRVVVHVLGGLQQEPRVKIMFKWYDLWVGAYIDTAKRYAYICPLPMLVIRVRY